MAITSTMMKKNDGLLLSFGRLRRVVPRLIGPYGVMKALLFSRFHAPNCSFRAGSAARRLRDD
ncbi:MAG: hypothetical protein ACXVJT_13465, partial [Thermoanaerobaculia bacterium]